MSINNIYIVTDYSTTTKQILQLIILNSEGGIYDERT